MTLRIRVTLVVLAALWPVSLFVSSIACWHGYGLALRRGELMLLWYGAEPEEDRFLVVTPGLIVDTEDVRVFIGQNWPTGWRCDAVWPRRDRAAILTPFSGKPDYVWEFGLTWPRVWQDWWSPAGGVQLPLWMVSAPSGLLVAVLLVKSRRVREECCRNCGYDLKGSPVGPCPECGEART